MEWTRASCAASNEAARAAALARQGQLTKPPGALARLEDIAVQLAALQGVERPQLQRIHISVFASDHGVAAEGVSVFPQAVTAEMVRNFARGGAAISVLAKQLSATLEVINLGTVSVVEALPGVRDERIAAGTANFLQQAAMTETQLAAALQSGRDAVLRAKQSGAQLFIGGEMGIANTTAASAIGCVLLQIAPVLLSGPGTGLDSNGVAHKARVIEQAIALHHLSHDNPLAALRHVGGFEIAGLCGAYIAAAQQDLPVLVDGFISSVAALAAVRINPAVRNWLLFGHTSAEPGHQRVLAALDAQPVLQLGMRLGEGSGAAVAVPILQLACALHNGMATFAEAGVSEKD
ncbi:MAG: nicotinate-nucleotide--dimethylbenzimidazole phosphoribosyltransferase [Gallionellales bacterium RIFCSPHIGHO2_02_FULL_57_16]|nr:MAG: nicotinate-nucleotide--dimethylbenzimidazole phosphoribosyltransferase [Gallionellales bacterium RIFCSPHIGHO2_02_FULL_57_16]